MSNKSKVLSDATIDATATVLYSNEIYLQSVVVGAFGLEVEDDAASLAITITLWAEAINGEGQAAGDNDDSTTYDTGWVQLGATHGWSGFPSGDPSGGNVLDTISFSRMGHRKLRFKLVRTAGTGVVSLSVNTKANV